MVAAKAAGSPDHSSHPDLDADAVMALRVPSIVTVSIRQPAGYRLGREDCASQHDQFYPTNDSKTAFGRLNNYWAHIVKELLDVTSVTTNGSLAESVY